MSSHTEQFANAVEARPEKTSRNGLRVKPRMSESKRQQTMELLMQHMGVTQTFANELSVLSDIERNIKQAFGDGSPQHKVIVKMVEAQASIIRHNLGYVLREFGRELKA